MPSLLRDLVGDRLAMMSQAAETYGDAVRIRIGPKTLYLFNHPDHAKHILADNAANYRKGIGLVQAKRALGDGLLTSEGELWREQRRTIQPVFQHRRIAARAGIVAREAKALVARLRAAAGGPPVDVTAEFTGLTLGVLGRTLLESDLGEFESLGHSFEAVQDQAMFEMVTMGAVPQWVPLPAQRRFRHARRELQRVVDILVERRHADLRADGDDVLTRLILSSERESDPAVARTRLRDELITLLLAGHETTASTLGWSLHLLDRNPEVWQRMHEEAVAVLGDRDPTDDDLRELRYTGQVIQEVIRLYPPVWILTREAIDEDVVDGFAVPAGSDVVVCPYTLHRHPAFWPEPDRFDPDRFASDRVNDRPRYAHIPFGAGPRFCVGSHLGLMEATFVLAMLARELRLRTAPGHTVTPQPMLSLRLGGGLPMTVSTR
jgi:cytochrome P450